MGNLAHRAHIRQVHNARAYSDGTYQAWMRYQLLGHPLLLVPEKEEIK